MKVLVNKPCPDVRYGARKYLLANGIDTTNDTVVVDGREFRKTIVYDSIVGANNEYNKFVWFCMTIESPRIIMEAFKSLPHATVFRTGTSDEFADEFSYENEYTRICTYDMSISLYDLICVISFFRQHNLTMFALYGMKIVSAVDSMIKNQIRIDGVFSSIVDKIAMSVNPLLEDDCRKAKSDCTLDEISEFNSGRNIKMVGLFDFLADHDILKEEISGSTQIKARVLECSIGGLLSEIRNYICFPDDPTERKRELIRQFIGSNSVESICPCGGDPAHCRYAELNVNRKLTGKTLCPVINNSILQFLNN